MVHHLRCAKVCVVGRLFIKRGVGPRGVVEPDSGVDDPFGLEPVVQFVQIDGLLFERSPQSLDEDVVEIPAATVHRDFDLGVIRSLDQYIIESIEEAQDHATHWQWVSYA
ncbi:hypothetical protein [Pseudogemmobacter sp. W21_MBD1_M6]|uniref:hypothetical protein n=1 Tax=Pseudogemmobacter sp. W21_MBD1_M6 TaxID=3240271 RepID=UPI003F9C86AF